MVLSVTLVEVLGAWVAVSLLSTAFFVCLCLAGRRDDLDRGYGPVWNPDDRALHALTDVPAQVSRNR